MTKTGFPFEIDIEVAFRDLDAMGHVNNAVFFSYLEHVRIKLMAELLQGKNFSIKNPADIPIILAKISCNYRSPAFFGEIISIGMGVSRIGSKSFDMVYEMRNGDGRLVATGHSVQVMFDYVANKTFPIPDSLKQRIKKLQGEWQPPTL